MRWSRAHAAGLPLLGLGGGAALIARALGLLSGPSGGVAAFALQRTVGLRFHPELSRSVFNDWLPVLTAHLPPPSLTVQRSADLNRDIESRLAAMHRAAETLCTWWASNLVSTGKPARDLEVTQSRTGPVR